MACFTVRRVSLCAPLSSPSSFPVSFMAALLNEAIHLMHVSSFGTLATISANLSGYPFATLLPFCPDESHCPLFLASGLAEHTKNFLADSRASFLVVDQSEESGPASGRMTVVGTVQALPVSNSVSERYLRYQPNAECRILPQPERFLFLSACSSEGALYCRVREDGMD